MAISPSRLDEQSKDAEVKVIELAIKKFDHILSQRDGGLPFYMAIIDDHLSSQARESIKSAYLDVDWAWVRCEESGSGTALGLWRIHDVHTHHCFPGNCKYGEDSTCTVNQVPPTHTMKYEY
jgi:hypothetical protein